MHLTELTDFLARGQGRGEFIYLASVDVASAFDAVPHENVLSSSVGDTGPSFTI